MVNIPINRNSLWVWEAEAPLSLELVYSSVYSFPLEHRKGHNEYTDQRKNTRGCRGRPFNSAAVLKFDILASGTKYATSLSLPSHHTQQADSPGTNRAQGLIQFG